MCFIRILRAARAMVLLALLHAAHPVFAGPAGYGVLLRAGAGGELSLLRVVDLAVEPRPAAGAGEELVWVDKDLTMAMPLGNYNRRETLPNGNTRMFDYLPVVKKLAPQIKAGMDEKLVSAARAMTVQGTQVCMKFLNVTGKLPTGLLYLGQPATREVKGRVDATAFVESSAGHRMKVLVNNLKFIPENDLEPSTPLSEFKDGEVVLKPQSTVWVFTHEWHTCN